MKCPRCGCKKVVHLVYRQRWLDKKIGKEREKKQAKLIKEPFTGREPSGYCPQCGENVCYPAYCLDVISVRFCIQTFPGPYPTSLLLERKPGAAQMSLVGFDDEIICRRELTSDEWCNVLHKLWGEFYLAEWKETYDNPDILDGMGWDLVITRENGEKKEYSGLNDFPPYWKELIKLFKPYFDEEFDLRALQQS